MKRASSSAPAMRGVVTRRGWWLCVALGAAALAAHAAAQDKSADAPWFRPETDPAALKEALNDDEISDRWIYHDLNAARAKARDTGKPIVALFRCVPCGSAPDLDAQLGAADGPLAALLDKFVAVRMVKMNGVNRNVFQFDPDVPYVAMFLNADGVVYGRYGTRTSKDRSRLPRHTLASFRQSLERVLALHGDYPGNRAALAPKRDKPKSPPFPEDMPTMAPFPSNPKEVSNCIHCHMVGEADTRKLLLDDKPARRDLWPYPPPETLGLRMEVNDNLLVKAVTADSPASRAGIEARDTLVSLAGQPLVSEADVQWVLHHAADEAQLPLVVRRGGQTRKLTLDLKGDWRRNATHWRASLTPARPDVFLEPDIYKHNKGVERDKMGLLVRYPRGAAAKAGLRNGDLAIAIDGRDDMVLEADFLKYIHIDRPAAKSVKMTVLRKGERIEVTLPVR